MESGLTITAIGMGVVFILLTLLVGIIQAMSVLAHALGGKPVASAKAPALSAARTTDEDIIPVIAAAISAYRSRHRPPRA
jgi:sodium pump decarboxylase gamma subunit